MYAFALESYVPKWTGELLQHKKKAARAIRPGRRKSTSVSQRGVKPPVARKAKVLCRGAPRMCLGSTRRLVTQAEQLPVVMDSKFTSAGDIASLAAAVAVVVAVAQP